jgi:hypothetical protein
MQACRHADRHVGTHPLDLVSCAIVYCAFCLFAAAWLRWRLTVFLVRNF